jgi:hypothetical protein
MMDVIQRQILLVTRLFVTALRPQVDALEPTVVRVYGIRSHVSVNSKIKTQALKRACVFI